MVERDPYDIEAVFFYVLLPGHFGVRKKFEIVYADRIVLPGFEQPAYAVAETVVGFTRQAEYQFGIGRNACGVVF